MYRQQLVGARMRRSGGRFVRGVIRLAAAACLSIGGFLLWLHVAQGGSPFRTPAGLILIALGLLQLRIAHLAWRQGAVHTPDLTRNPLFWRWLLAGPAVCYLAALWLGSDLGGGYFFVAATALWSTAAVAPLALQADARQRVAALARPQAVVGLGWGAFAALALLTAAELTVRTYGLVTGGHLPGAYAARRRALSPGCDYAGRRVNTQGYWDDDFSTAPRPGVFRIAALGDAMVLSGAAGTNYLDQVERRVPNIEIYNFGIPQVGPREYAAQLAHEVLAYQPDMVLTFVSIGDDIAQPTPAPGLFDWRGLGIYQLGICTLRPSGELASPLLDARFVNDREGFLRAAAGRLSVCRTPIDGPMRDRWQESLAHLDRIVRACREQDIATALVLVPGEFQVCSPLCESLRRNAGYDSGQLDLELPQRRLTEFANQREVPVLDLLPHLRASSTYPYERNDYRWNDSGNAIAADVVGGWLQRRYGAQLAASAHAATP